MKNSLQQIASVVRLQSRAGTEEAREALEKTLDPDHGGRPGARAGLQARAARSGCSTPATTPGTGPRPGRVPRPRRRPAGDEVDSAILDLRQAGPLALILNELVTNALKYGCPTDRPAASACNSRLRTRTYRLSVADEARACPRVHTAIKTSLGMRAIEALAGNWAGARRRTAGSGAVFAVRLPEERVHDHAYHGGGRRRLIALDIASLLEDMGHKVVAEAADACTA